MVILGTRLYIIFLFIILLSYSLMFVSSSNEFSVLFSYELWSNHSFSVDFSLLFDKMSVMFMSVVLLISSSVLIYCYWYMSDELYYNRFVMLVCSFVLSMMFLIFIPNLVSVMLGWDGLGLTSFLLVCYYHNNKSLSASLLTALTNRIGDVFILLSIAFFLPESGWYVYNSYSMHNLVFVSFLLTMSALTKSAQFPFCAWLPAAMAAPTPVSALVHSSTLVTAGVYLLIRSHNLINSTSLMLLQIISLITLMLAGTSAFLCIDVKKIVALSTLSQLSLMMFSLSINMPFLSFFHLVTHAMFKALLFLSVGAVIHYNKYVQDIRMLGGMWSFAPVSMSVMVIANCSLSGLPFLSGFFSKDLILDVMYEKSMIILCYYLCLLGSMFTGLYCMRMSWMIMYSLHYADLFSVRSKESINLLIPYLSLSFGSVFLGGVLKMKVEELIKFSSISNYEVMTLSSLFLFSGVFFLMSVMKKVDFYSSSFLSELWYMESVTSQPLCEMSMEFSRNLNKSLDKGWLEMVGPQGSYSFLLNKSSFNEKFQNSFFLRCMGLMLMLFLGFILFIILSF